MTPFIVSFIPDGFVDAQTKRMNCALVISASVESMSDLGSAITTFHFAPGVFYNDRRSIATFNYTHLLAFDFDHGASVESVIEKVKHERHLIAASKNHLVDKGDGKGAIPRFHLFLYRESPIQSPDEYKRQIALTKERLRLEDSDPACSDCSRYFFKHKEILSVKDTLTSAEIFCQRWREDEERKRKEITIIRPPKVIVPQKVAGRDRKRDHVSQFKRTKYFTLMENGGLSVDGSRQVNCCKCVGAMRLCGVQRDDAERLIHEYSTWGKSYTSKAVSRILDQFL